LRFARFSGLAALVVCLLTFAYPPRRHYFTFFALRL
jgi:hypothetical protein